MTPSPNVSRSTNGESGRSGAAIGAGLTTNRTLELFQSVARASIDDGSANASTNDVKNDGRWPL